MLTLLFMIFLIVFVWKSIVLAVKMTWGLTKVMVTIIFFPLILLGLVFAGMFYIAFPALVILWLISLVLN